MAHQQTANRQRPQNSLGALDCEARIARARSGFQRIRIAIRLTSTTYCHAQRVGGRWSSPAAPSRRCPTY